MPPYTHIQFINHVFNTRPLIEDEEKSEKMTYLGLPRGYQDIAARVEFVKQVITAAKNNSNIKHSPTPNHKNSHILKVFMMPEFAFRGSTGAYDMQDAFSLMEKLQDLVKEEEWQDWLFVFGTIVCKSYATKKIKSGGHKEYPIDLDKDVEVYNIAPIQKGGFQHQPAHQFTHTVLKGYKSTEDFIKEEKLKISGDGRLDKHLNLLDEKVKHLDVLPVPQNFSKFKPPADEKLSDEELLKLKYRYIYGDSVFDRDGITFGLEICYDHQPHKHLKKLMATAGKVLEKEKIQPKQIAIHLLTSCGMKYYVQSIAAKEGYFAQCDGSGKDEFSLVKGTHGRNKLFQQEHVPDLFSVKLLDFSPLSINSVQIAKANETQTIPLNKLYSDGAGKLQIYDASPLPPFEQMSISHQKSLSFHLTNELSTDDAESPVLLNGMTVLFDKVVPVSPVSLIPKEKLSHRKKTKARIAIK